jgi:hypothetical protein
MPYMPPHRRREVQLEVRHNEECWDVMVFESVTIILMYIDAIKCQRGQFGQILKILRATVLLLKISRCFFFLLVRRDGTASSFPRSFLSNATLYD